MKATAASVRAIALALPGASEREHLGSSSFRIGEKIFAQLNAQETVALVKMSFDDQTERHNAAPDRFSLPAHWSRFGWTYVRLAGFDLTEMRLLLERSWAFVAPKKVVREFEAARARSLRE